jgi:glycosyltransferase involved in cell wall biosynthesis
MATFNGATFIGNQLTSIASQTHIPLELIVSDDGSDDDTLSIAEEFRRFAPFPVHIQRNETRLGYAANFLKAAGSASGEYIAFCDQDDIWHPNKIEVALKTLRRTGAELFVHAAKLIDTRGEVIGRFSQGITTTKVYLPRQLGPWSVYYGFSMVFPAKLLRLIDPSLRGPHTFEFEGLLSHDLWVYCLASSLGKIAVEARPLACYRQHYANQTPHLRPGSFSSWWTALGVAAHPKLQRSEIAAHRSSVMEQLSRSAPEQHLKEAAASASRYWQKISAYERARTEIYSAPSFFRRSSRMANLAVGGGYRAFGNGGLGWRLLIKDAIVGVLRMRRHRVVG